MCSCYYPMLQTEVRRKQKSEATKCLKNRLQRKIVNIFHTRRVISLCTTGESVFTIPCKTHATTIQPHTMEFNAMCNFGHVWSILGITRANG